MKTKLLIAGFMLLMSIMATSCFQAEPTQSPTDTYQEESGTYLSAPLLEIEAKATNPEGDNDITPPSSPDGLQLWKIQVRYVKHDTIVFGNFKPKVTTDYDSAGPYLVKTKKRPTLENLAGPLKNFTPPGYSLEKFTHLQRLK